MGAGALASHWILCEAYHPELSNWDLLELLRKLMLTGFVFLVPQRHSLLRIVIGLLISIAHVVLLAVAQPYRQASTAAAAIATSVLLQCTLSVAQLVMMFDTLDQAQIMSFFGFDSVLPLAAVIFGFSLLVIAAALAFLLLQVRIESQAHPPLRLKATGVPPTLTLASQKRWHLFIRCAFLKSTGAACTSLAHTSSDRLHLPSTTTAIIGPIRTPPRPSSGGCSCCCLACESSSSTRLGTRSSEKFPCLSYRLSCLPTSSHLCVSPCAILDSVDDLASIDDLERHVEASQAMLILLGSTKYMSSPNCQKEVAAARRCGLPMVHVHDADSAKGGAVLTELRRTADSHKLSRAHTGLLFNAAADEIVPWHRVAAFQLNALAAIAERLLLASPAYQGEAAVPLYVDGALAWAEASFAQPVALYTSLYNPAAAEAARELSELYSGLQLVGDREAAARWLLFLGLTCFEGESGVRLAAEVAAVLRRVLIALACNA